MELLQEIKDRGYPAEYLLARIHGRRKSLLSNRDRVLSGPELSEYHVLSDHGTSISAHPQDGTWKRFLKESSWIYYQMNNRLRNIFRPYFMYSELTTLLICLRYKAAKGSSAEIARLLEFSLLSEKIRYQLNTDTDVPSVLNMLEKKAFFIHDNSAGLEQAFLKDGFKGVEQKISGALFEYILNMNTHPLITRFFVFIADARNIITLHKYMRWDTTSVPSFIEGGNIKKTTLTDILRSYNTDALAALVYRQTGLRIDSPDAARAETALQRRLTGMIKKWERESPDIGLILNYLWRCAVEAKNLSILYHGRELDRGILKEELVY